MIVLFGVSFGRLCLCVSSALRMVVMPSSCGMFVYSEVTSATTNIVFLGSGGKLVMSCKRCLVSLRYEGCACAIGLKTAVRYLERLSVGESHPLMIGRGGLFGL